jgi:hypothetical protein
MPEVLITCPASGEAINTGIAVSKEVFHDPKTIMSQNVVSCPHCNQRHLWGKKDAYLEGDKPK